ncbi:hypothetical protein F511_27436 [Dorcoceras hygrometricum]|uniref:Uncharacterized protein n=1 Tax=Dorcoceras hygrometricum TaxID=472368 RepID=A0A2Z7AT83_9LAMI|nr:hypothetical protein F511_27436 [Dorcoceras hygrometricum]
MRNNSNKRPSRKHDRKVLVAEESTKSWADSDSESSSSSSSSSDSEQEEVHCLMANQMDDNEVFDFSNVEFTREDLFQTLNDMVHEYKTLSHTFEEIKAENASLKNSSVKSSSDELEDTDSLKTEFSKLRIENELLRSESSELKAEVEKLTKEMSSWTQSARAFQKLQEIQKSTLDRTGLSFSNSESSGGETSTQSQPVYDKFNKMGFVKDDVIYDCCESIRYDDQNSSQSSHEGKGKDGIGYQSPESSKPSWLNNRLDKEKRKLVPNGDPTINFTSDDVQLQDHPADNRTCLPASSTDFSEAIDDLKTYLAQSIADSQNDILSKLNTIVGCLREDLQQHENTVRAQVNNSCQDTRLHINGLIVNMGEYRKGVQNFGASVKSDNLDIQRKIDAQQAKLDDLDTQIAAMRNDQLEFQAKIAADLLSLSIQIGDIVDYLRSGDAKKGEGDSSRGPKPTPVRVERHPLPTPQPSPDNQGSGGIRTTTIVDRNQSLSVEQAAEFV